MSHAYSNFRTRPSYYSRDEVARDRTVDPHFEAFLKTINFCLERFNRGQETMRMEVVTTDRLRSRHDVSFHLEGRPDLVIAGKLVGDLLSVDGFCYDAGTRPEFFQLLPRISRALIEMEYDASVPRC
ncbi:hypothetical protein [Rhizobium leguminosarum]|uniref:hypothetical protein n=1 Tax=Rhizobium leguminosarum TaxID=384 RepID=UPI002E0F1BE7|nr:hypothetical protein U8Q02_38945 [Rhizobium leguminosarum]